jgi:translation initiation factor 2 beta subunit (eIF-2beta)/eIF-5
MQSLQLPYVVEGSTPIELAINPQEQADSHYRYQMHQLHVQFRGKFTILQNLETVALELNLPPEHIAQYLAYNLNAVVKQDKKRPPSERWALSPTNGNLAKISSTVVGLIREFVLCPKCARPELHYSEPSETDLTGTSATGTARAAPPKGEKGKKGGARAKAKSNLIARCQSCGWQRRVADMKPTPTNAKFIDFMCSHPPPPVPDLLGSVGGGRRLRDGLTTGNRCGGTSLLMLNGTSRLDL